MFGNPSFNSDLKARMRATIINLQVRPCYCPTSRSTFHLLSRQLNSSIERTHPRLGFSNFKGRGAGERSSVHLICGAIDGGSRSSNPTSSPLDDKPYELLPGGKRAYLDEQDVVTFIDPPKDLIPLDPSSYNPAAYLWKKIDDVPEERRHRLLSLLKPRLISRAWEIAGTKFEDPKLAKKTASSLLSNGVGVKSPEFWNCRSSGGPTPIAWINFFKKAVFSCKDGTTYGRFIGGSVLAGFSDSYPLYFMVRQLNEVMSTEQPCDLGYEFGDGLLDLHDYPQGFPKPAKHPWPFNDQVVVYVRHVGPGVVVGQAWQEGEALQQVPKKLCGEILMVKDYAALGETH